MGGGQKRGRTQRRHFRQGRENVWKHNNPKKTRSEDDQNPNPNPNGNWEPFISQNPGFEEYYKEQGIVPKEEWEEFMVLLRKPLPAAFRINSSGQFFENIRSQLENDFMKSLEAEFKQVNNEHEIEAIRPLPWYPDNLAWHLNFSRMQLRKNQTLERFHEFLKQENEVGNITRQEAVSMVPPLFLDVLPDHHILDMCAAPGSKTFQLLEVIHQSTKPGQLPNGLIIANDVDVQRCNLLIHQTKRMSTANLIVTNHEAQHFPSCYLMKGCSEAPNEGLGEIRNSVLQFDRILCDVPCSGDGTLRKAPDIWRKWNAGMGNGVHRLQVEIAMRGIALLKVGGRMVYSTCSMNPVENEAVIAEVLRRSNGSVELLDVSSELPNLIRRHGLSTWKVRDKGVWLASHKDVPNYRKNVVVPSMFPSGHCYKDENKLHKVVGVNEPDMEIEPESVSHIEQTKSSENNAMIASGEAAAKIGEVLDKCDSEEHLDSPSIVEVSTFPLERCMRIVPHDQNTGAFFIAVLHKLSPLQENKTSQITNITDKAPTNISENLEDTPHDDHPVEAEMASDANLKDEQVSEMSTEDKSALESKEVPSKENGGEEVEEFANGESGHSRRRAKGKLQTQGKWRGVDPVVFFRDEAIINSIRSFYGISESIPLDGHLVTRNSDASHVKRIYYVSKSVHDVLELNFQVGQRLKITSLGLKVFERQSSKDGSAQCAFRLSSEGLPLLLPYISKQIVFATLADFQHLLQYRTIKFSDFVDVEFGEKASALMPGCCVVVLNEGSQNADTILTNASTIAIICWKGKNNMSIMVSQLDGQELLERLYARFGKHPVRDENETANPVTDDVENAEDGVEGSEVARQGTVSPEEEEIEGEY